MLILAAQPQGSESQASRSEGGGSRIPAKDTWQSANLQVSFANVPDGGEKRTSRPPY